MGNVQTAVRAYDQPWRPAPGDLVELGRTLRLPLGQLRLQRTPVSGLKRRDKLALGLLCWPCTVPPPTGSARHRRLSCRWCHHRSPP